MSVEWSGQFLVFRLGHYAGGEWITIWSTAWKFWKETEIRQHYYSPWNDLKFLIKKEEDKWTPQWRKTSTVFFSTSPDLLINNISINHLTSIRYTTSHSSSYPIILWRKVGLCPRTIWLEKFPRWNCRESNLQYYCQKSYTLTIGQLSYS